MNPEDFETIYRDSRPGDPWEFATSSYEQRRYDLAVGCLDRVRYRRAFEPGCATGELTARLATRCDEVVALDPSPTALGSARTRVRDLPGVSLAVGAVPEDWPVSDRFDLVVLSELGYYFGRDELVGLVRRSLDALVAGGQLLAVHWRGHSEDHLLHGDEVHEIIETTVGLAPAVRLTDPRFLVGRWDLP